MKKFLAVFLSVILVMPTVATGVFAATDPSTVVIVEFEDDALLETQGAIELGGDYLETNSASLMLNSIEKRQDNTIDSIEGAIGRQVDVEYNYTHAFNGAAFEVNESDIEAIENVPGVKNVYKSCTLKLLSGTPSAYNGENFSSGEMIGLEEMRELGYDGEGRAVAVIDGGIYPDHEAFKLTDDSTAKYSYDDIENIIANGNFNSENITASEVYRSAKIPFAFDYGRKTNEVDEEYDDGASHGTHVCGIIGGNSETLTGIAPEVQLLMFKVDVYDSIVFIQSLIAALDDAVKFDVDAVNMSVGEDLGCTTNPDYAPIQTGITTIRNAGILVCCAAGNAGRGGGNTFLGFCEPSKPDYSQNGVPSNFTGSTSVASANNIHANYLFSGTEKMADGTEIEIGYFETVFESKIISASSTFDYCVVDPTAVGAVSNKELAGKIVLVDFASPKWYQFSKTKTLKSEYSELINNSGALAVIFTPSGFDALLSYTVNEYEYAAYDGYYPDLAVLENEVFEALVSARTKTLTHTYGNSLKISDFSSWAFSNDLKTGVDITAPGATIRSSVESGYDYYDGTSMASPMVAGAAALLGEYIAKTFKTYTGAEKSQLLENLLMNGAKIARQADGVAYSPRQQGAGVMDIAASAKTKTLLTDALRVGEATILLGSLNGAEFSFDIKLTNLSAQMKTYDLSAEFLTDGYEVIEGNEYNDDSVVVGDMVALNAQISGSLNGIKVAAGSSRIVTINVALSSQQVAENLAVFTNGFFVDGFVTAVCGSENVSIPVYGFYGDWANLPVVDSFDAYSSSGEIIVNVETLRPAKEMSVDVFDEQGKKFSETQTVEGVLKYGSYGFTFTAPVGGVINGDYTVVVTVTPEIEGANEQQYTSKRYFDSNAPIIKDMSVYTDEDGMKYLIITSPDDDLYYAEIIDTRVPTFGESISYYDLEIADVNEQGDYIYALSLYYWDLSTQELDDCIISFTDTSDNTTTLNYPTGIAAIVYNFRLLLSIIMQLFFFATIRTF